jgi:hypothetical protein
MNKLFHIKNNEGKYYVGTAERKPVFGAFESRARFSKDSAEQRVKGLRRGGGNFEIVPEDAGRSPE